MNHFDNKTKGLGDVDEVKSKLKALVDGQMIMQLTGAKGPEIGKIKSQVEEWILNDNPDATREDVEQYILSIY